jgi:beta-galactosidase
MPASTPPMTRPIHVLMAATILGACRLASAPTLVLPVPGLPDTAGFRMGADTRPDGATLSLTSRSLLREGRPWMPVMGEFHYARYPEDEWREELLKMKAGGIDIVASYVFWIHHEEIEGQWDWSGRRSLRRFIETCHEVGLLAAVRCGPWCHGEVRNGGIPDWALAKGWKVRTDDPAYLDHVRVLYGEIAAQLRGLLWKDGGPVVAIQLENEYGGPADHLLALKHIAREAGLDVPLYTRTGWPLLKTPMPFGEIAPLFGAYAEGFWDRELTSMPGKYWAAFRFQSVRTDAAIATEQLGERAAEDEADAHRYPYLTCELGGGMISSYHRRIAIDPIDIEAVALVKIGSGGNLPGYYMYHGGTNPDGRLSTLMEAQDTPMTNWNDMPVKGYDFFAPLGEYGQLRPHYHLLRRLHLLARDFGETLATLPAVLPDKRPSGRDDLTTLRWSVRTDGTGGFLFVNNHQRGVTLPPHEGVQFRLRSGAGELVLPSQPVTVPAGARFIWPFNLDLGHGIRLVSASAQPLCSIEEDGLRTVFLAAQPGMPVEVHLADATHEVIRRDIRPSRSEAAMIRNEHGAVRLVVLEEADSLALWRGVWRGRERAILSPAAVVFDGDTLRLTSPEPDDLHASVFPPPAAANEGVFQKLQLSPPALRVFKPAVAPLRPAGPAREIQPGRIAKPVAAAPTEADFAAAAVWRIQLPDALGPDLRVLLRLHYRGDVARVMIGDHFITDDFYNGRPFEIGLWRHAGELARSGGELRLLVLPLRRDAPIHLPSEAWPQSVGESPVAELVTAELIPLHTVEFTSHP